MTPRTSRRLRGRVVHIVQFDHTKCDIVDDTETAMHAEIANKRDALIALCERYDVAWLEVCGSAARGTDFNHAGVVAGGDGVGVGSHDYFWYFATKWTQLYIMI